MGNSTPVVARTSSAALAALCVLVAACGGGGGGPAPGPGGGNAPPAAGAPPAGNTANLTAANAQTTASGSYGKSRGSTNIAGAAGSASRRAELGAPQEHLFDVKSFGRRHSTALTSNQPMAAVLTPDVENGFAGTITSTVNDVDNSEDLSTGDTVNVVFADYREDNAEDDLVNGTLDITILSYNESADPLSEDFSYEAEFAFNLTVREFGSSTADPFTASCVISEEEVDGQSTMTFFLDDEDGGIVVYNSETSDPAGWEIVTGGFFDAGDDTWYEFYTLDEAPFRGTGDDSEANPTSGVLIIEDADGYCALTAQSDGLSVRIQVDENDDGTFELDQIVLWSALDG